MIRAAFTLLITSAFLNFSPQCFAVDHASVEYGLYSVNAGYYPSKRGFVSGETFATAGGGTNFSDDEEYTQITLNTAASGTVGGNGANGLGLMRLSATGTYFRNEPSTIPYPPPRPHDRSEDYSTYGGSISGFWTDTLNLKPGTSSDPVFLKMEVTATFSHLLRTIPMIYTPLSMARESYAHVLVSTVSAGHTELAIYGDSLVEVRYRDAALERAAEIQHTQDGVGWESYTVDGNSFRGVALLPVYAASSGSADVRNFVLEGAVGFSLANAAATADAGHTMSFLGVFDAGGNPILDASFDSGLTPTVVPEPSIFALAALGMIALMALKRHKSL